MSRRRPPPSDEEMALWDTVTRSVAPLKRRKPAAVAKPPKETSPPGKPHKPAPAPRPMAAPPKPKPPKPPALAPLDRRTLSRVNRGAVSIDTRIDLHGMTQAAAHGRLIDFLHAAQASGARLVLVITGKGKNGGEQERGILRRLVPIWLASHELRPVVVGFDEAGRAHGGAGALLVRLRRAQR